jgi:hypothetical protein
MNMRCRLLLRGLIILAAVTLFGYKQLRVPAAAAAVEEAVPFADGEKITYSVKMGPVRMGGSTLSFEGKTVINGKEAFKIIFVTTGLNFLDKETIYADTKTFYPVRVERKLNLWGKKMDIVEDYDAKDNSWRLTKRQGRKITQEVFKSGSRVQNIISLVYFYRQMKDLSVDRPLEFNLSNAQVTMKIKGMEDMTIGNKRYKAYLIESVPPKYRVWLAAGKQRLPLRIEGSLLSFGHMAMIMKSHN